MNVFTYNEHVSFLKKIFSKKPDQLNSVLLELKKAMSSDFNLTKDYLISRFNYDSVILTWNGSTDKQILLRLGFDNKMLNLTAYDSYNNNNYYLNLYNFHNNNIIVSYCLGYVKKNGRYLSLTETHQLICKNKIHTSLIVHNPVNDVILTSCIFQYLLKSTQTTNILNLID